LYQGRLGLAHRNVSQFFHFQNLAPDLDYGAGLRSYNNDNPEAESRGIAGLTFGWGYVIPADKDDAVKEAAFEWVQRIAYDEEAACLFVFEQARPSPLQPCNENPEYQQVNPYWDVVQESLQRDVAVGIVPPQARILDAIDQNVELAMYGEVSAEEALEEAAAQAQSLLDAYWNSAS
jgi:ABC-type glycerol-3-phosphate transport system substrate-binding protein